MNPYLYRTLFLFYSKVVIESLQFSFSQGNRVTRALYSTMETLKERENQHKVRKKRMNSEEIDEERGEDRISTLQDCLLLEILSRLPSTKDAIRTGTLSKRWQHVWTSVPILSFTTTDNYIANQGRQNPKTSSDFFSLVTKTLTQCPQLHLEKFKVDSGYNIEFESQVNSWIRYAVSRGVEELYLSFGAEPFVEVLLDQSFFICSCFTNLCLQSCKLNPTGEITWKNLRSLCLKYGEFDDGLIENILSGSPVLERLYLGYGRGYQMLNITSKSLKKLVIFGYVDIDTFDGDEIVTINAPNILSLEIRELLAMRKILLVNVSSLMEAYLDFRKRVDSGEEDMLKILIQNLGHVKEVIIEGACSESVAGLEAKGFEFPSNVKFVDYSYWYGDSD